jgi:hypothetical protein
VPYLLRKIKRSNWFSEVDWLPANELQADALGDLASKNNELSVWFVSDDNSNLTEVVAALSLSGDYVSIVDYALIDLDLLSNQGFDIAQNPGVTPFDSANHWHRDLVRLTARRVLELAELVKKARRERCRDKDALNYVSQAINSGKVDISKIRPGFSRIVPGRMRGDIRAGMIASQGRTKKKARRSGTDDWNRKAPSLWERLISP